MAGLGDQGDNGDARVATDNGDVLVRGVATLDFADEAGGADNVEGGYTEEAFWVVDTFGLEDFGADGYRGVDLWSSGLDRRKDRGERWFLGLLGWR